MRKPPRPRSTASRPRPAGFVLGRDGFARISAVEGIELTPDMRAAMDGFDRAGLSSADRLRAIKTLFAPSL